MKKKFFMYSLLCLSLITLVACSSKKEATKDTSSASSTSQTETTATSTKAATVTSVSSSATLSENTTPESTSEAQQFNQLSEPLKVLLATTIVDNRAFNLSQGLNLGYHFDNDLLYVQIHSGVGSGHPIFEIANNEEEILPQRGYVNVGPSKLELVTNFPATVSKSQLYNLYVENKDDFDHALAFVGEAPGLTQENFEKTFSSIVN